MENKALIKWMQDTYSSTSHPLQYLLSVCTGSWLLAHSGKRVPVSALFLRFTASFARSVYVHGWHLHMSEFEI